MDAAAMSSGMPREEKRLVAAVERFQKLEEDRQGMQERGGAFAVPLPVLVVNDATGEWHRGTLQLPRLAPPAPVPP